MSFQLWSSSKSGKAVAKLDFLNIALIKMIAFADLFTIVAKQIESHFSSLPTRDPEICSEPGVNLD